MVGSERDVEPGATELTRRPPVPRLRRGDDPGSSREPDRAAREGVPRRYTEGQRVVLSMRPDTDLTTSGTQGQRKSRRKCVESPMMWPAWLGPDDIGCRRSSVSPNTRGASRDF